MALDQLHDENQELEKSSMSFLDHLETLRWHIIRSVLSIVVFAVIAFLAKDFVFNTIILAPSRTDFITYQWLCQLGDLLNSPNICIEELRFTLQSRKMHGQFAMHITSSIVIGFILAFPYAFWEFWRFIKPGLYSKEKHITTGAVAAVSFLFLSGILFGYYIVSPLSINFLAGYSLDESIVNLFDITSYIGTLSMIVLACGLMFQLPMVIWALSKIGVCTPAAMRQYRRHAFVGFLLSAAVITPPDLFSQFLVTIPLFILYELSIYLSAYEMKKQKQQMEEDEV